MNAAQFYVYTYIASLFFYYLKVDVICEFIRTATAIFTGTDIHNYVAALMIPVTTP